MKHLIPFSLYPVDILVLHTLHTIPSMFSCINDNNFPIFGFPNLFFFVFVFATIRKQIFAFKYFGHWFNSVLSQCTLIWHEMFCDYQTNLGNTANVKTNLQGGGGRYSIFPKRGRILYVGTW